MTPEAPRKLLLNQELFAPESIGLMADSLLEKGFFLTTAESCTGGMIAAACTDLSGSSAYFERGFVTYSNAAKTQMLGVDAMLIAQHGAVSEPVARAMAFGAIRHSAAQVSVAVTGVAGPTGGTTAKPVGTVWFGFSVAGMLTSERMLFAGDRTAVRAATVQYAIDGLIHRLRSTP